MYIFDHLIEYIQYKQLFWWVYCLQCTKRLNYQTTHTSVAFDCLNCVRNSFLLQDFANLCCFVTRMKFFIFYCYRCLSGNYYNFTVVREISFSPLVKPNNRNLWFQDQIFHFLWLSFSYLKLFLPNFHFLS